MQNLRLAHSFFFFNDTATTEIYTLSLHDALPIYFLIALAPYFFPLYAILVMLLFLGGHRIWNWRQDRKSTRLNSSHTVISYAVFCLKKNKNLRRDTHSTGIRLSRRHMLGNRLHSP